MKNIILTLLMTVFSMTGMAQVTVEEPQFVNTYNILTSDSTYVALPKENGTLRQHENKSRKITKVLGHAATVAGALGGLGAVTSGSWQGLKNGVRVMHAANTVGAASDATNALTGASGMDISFSGPNSTYVVRSGADVRLLIKGENNDTDPIEIYRIVKFSTKKKERYIQWMEFSPALLGSSEAKQGGYLSFIGEKYREQSYLLTIPASELEPGEYGIFYLDIATALTIPVGTFSVQ